MLVMKVKEMKMGMVDNKKYYNNISINRYDGNFTRIIKNW